MSDQLQSNSAHQQFPRGDRRTSGALELDDTHLTDYIKVLWRRRWAAFTVFTAVMVAVVVYTFTATPIYRSRVQLLIENENPNVVSFKEVIEQEKTTNDYYQTQYKMLQSRSLARRTLDHLGLWGYFTPSDTGGARQAVANAVAPVTDFFRRGKSNELPAPDETAA